MKHEGPADLPVEQTLRFLDRALPMPGSRVLEVGCGSGALAARLQARGFHVTALDRSAEDVAAARARGVHAIEADFLSYQGEPFDAILFARSLHHLEALAKVMHRVHALLTADGLLVAEEFAVERADRDTARWFYELRSLLEAAGLMPPDAEGAMAANPLERWYAEHEKEHPLHAGEDMLMAIASRFEIARHEEAPYLYRYVCDRIETSVRGLRVAHWVLELESLRIAERSLRATGLRVVARKGR